MNKEEILNLKAGKALNMLIAEKVIGLIAWQEKRGDYTHIVFQKPEDREPYKRSRNWEKEMDRYRRIEYSDINNHIHVVQEIKEYSSDISAAWEVIERLGAYASVEIRRNHDAIRRGSADVWECKIGLSGSRWIHSASAEATPESISKAALLAVMNL